MYSLTHVTNSVLKRANDTGADVTPMKLQKLLYFLYKAYLKQTNGDPLFSERFQPWKYGPVLSDVYYAFNDYRANFIKRYYPDADGISRYVTDAGDPVFRLCLADTWRKYSDYSGIDLSIMTHRDDSAWTKAISRGSFVLFDEDILHEPDFC